MDCVVSVEVVLEHWWTVSYQLDWYWDSGGLCSIRRTGNEIVVYCFV